MLSAGAELKNASSLEKDVFGATSNLSDLLRKNSIRRDDLLGKRGQSNDRKIIKKGSSGVLIEKLDAKKLTSPRKVETNLFTKAKDSIEDKKNRFKRP